MPFATNNKPFKGFTLIEMLVVISIIGVLMAVSLVAFQQSRTSARDTKRKADLESIRSALELYRADCGSYPPGSLAFGESLVGQNPPCSDAFTGNTYMAQIPKDPQDPLATYYYTLDGTTYHLCAKLENSSETTECGNNCTGTCNYQLDSP